MSRHATLYLVRHGQTQGNGQRYVGWEDLPLDAAGQAQAQAAGTLLRHRPLQAIYTSPLQRARATATALLATGTGPGGAARPAGTQVHEGLKEIHYGDFQGLFKDEQPLRLRRDHLHARMPAGESLVDVHARVAAFAQALLARLVDDAEVAVVAHFWSLRMLSGVLGGQSAAELLAGLDYKPANGSVWVLDLDLDQDPPAPGRTPRLAEAGRVWHPTHPAISP